MGRENGMKGYSGWDYKPYYPLDESFRRGHPYIAALRPGDGSIEIEWYDEKQPGAHSLCIWDEEDNCREITTTDNRIFVKGLENGKTYRVCVADTEDRERSTQIRKVVIAPVVGYPINYLHPQDTCYAFSGHALCSPGIVKLKSGTLLVSMDVYENIRGQNLTKIFASYDDGKTWNYITDLFPCFWGKLFEYRDSLYMLGFTTEYGDLIIGQSKDEGRTWSEYTTLFPGSGNRWCGGPHRAPLNIMEYQGRLWAAVDFGTWEKGGHMSGVVSVDVRDDFMLAKSWTMSKFLPYNAQWNGAATGESRGCLEGNIVKLPDGTLCNFLRYQIDNCTPSHDRAVLLKIDPDRPEKQLEFYKVIDFMGGLTKFSIVYDEVTKQYLALINRVIDEKKPMSRNMLSLITSGDAVHWDFVRDMVDCSAYEESEEKIGMQYPDLLIDGDDLIWVQRTAMNNAANFHDSNYITFHRMREFRKYICR